MAAKNSLLYIDDITKKFVICYFDKSKKEVRNEQEYGYNIFSVEFFDELKTYLIKYSQDDSEFSKRVLTVVIPNFGVTNSIISNPVINKKELNNLRSTLSQMFVDSQHVKYKSVQLSKTKEQANYYFTFANTLMLQRLRTAILNAKIQFGGVTFKAAATSIYLNNKAPKLRGTTFLYSDVHETFTNFVYIVNGRAMGSYRIPVGTNSFVNDEVLLETTLFPHPDTDLIVLNAKEKAKARALTTSTVSEEPLDEEDQELLEASMARKVLAQLKKLGREEPTTPDDIQYENFRILMKWCLLLLLENKTLRKFGNFEKVVINIKDEYKPLIDRANLEQDENEILFEALDLHDKEKASMSDLYGAFEQDKINQVNWLA